MTPGPGGPQIPHLPLGKVLSSIVTLSILMTTGEEVGVESHTNGCDSHPGDHTLSSSPSRFSEACVHGVSYTPAHVNTCALIKDALVPHPSGCPHLSPAMLGLARKAN